MNVCPQLKSKIIFKVSIHTIYKSAFDYRYHECYDIIHTSLMVRISGKSGMSPHEINAMICDGMNDAIVHCSKILTNCIEPKANIEMQNEQWKILQASFENFQCRQYLLTASSSVTPAINTFYLMYMIYISIIF